MGDKYPVAATADDGLNTLQALRPDLEVTVIDAVTKSVIAEATVEISGPVASKATTDARGVALFVGIPAGHYTVWGERGDYISGSTEVEVPVASASRPVVTSVLLEPITLEIVDSGGRLIPSGATRVVGQKVALVVRSKPAGHALSEIEWVVPGDRVKNYTQSTTQGKVFKLDDADLKLSAVGFYWISGGTRTVRVVAKIGGRQREATASIDVLAPTDVVMTSVTSTFSILDGSTAALRTLGYGTKSQFGIVWTFSATGPSIGGTLAGVQLVKLHWVEVFNNDSTEVAKTTDGRFFLDDQVPYAPAASVVAGMHATWTNGDRPQMGLGHNMVAGHMNNEFRIFFMYRPDGADSIWVTLGRLDWHCHATARRKWPEGGTPAPWSVDPGADANQNPVGVSTSELPVWVDLMVSGG